MAKQTQHQPLLYCFPAVRVGGFGRNGPLCFVLLRQRLHLAALLQVQM